MRCDTRAEARMARSSVAASVTPVPRDVGDGNVARRRQLLDLLADAVDEHELDAEAAQDRDVDEQVAEILVGDDGAVEGDDKDLPLEPRHVFEDAAEIRGFDRGDGGAVAHRDGVGVFFESRAPRQWG